MNVAPQLTAVAPTELSTATEWAADCNIAIALIHAPDASLPNFRDMFWHWISRRHGLKGYLEPQLTESTFSLLSVSFESPALRFVPLLPAGRSTSSTGREPMRCFRWRQRVFLELMRQNAPCR